jgi:hypothetical protein
VIMMLVLLIAVILKLDVNMFLLNAKIMTHVLLILATLTMVVISQRSLVMTMMNVPMILAITILDV